MEATPEEVWAVLVRTERWQEWATFHVVERGQLSKDAPVRIGFRIAGLPVSARCRFIAVEAGSTLWWRGGLPWLLDVRHGFDLHPVDGGTRVEHTETFGGVLGWAFAALVQRGDDNYRQTNAGLERQVTADRSR